MKYRFLTSWVIFGLCMPMVADAVSISGPGDLAGLSIPTNENIYINGNGTYSLAQLRDVAGAGIMIQVNNPVTLSVDDSFVANNVFNTHLNLQTNVVLIRFDNEFLDEVTGENNNLLQFNNLERDGLPDIIEQTASSDYSYEWFNCGTAACIRRRYSNAYLAAHQASAGLSGISSIVQYTPSVLLRPVSTINQHELFDVYNFTDDYFVSLTPEYYNARDFNDMGLRLNAGAKVSGRLFVGASAYLSTAEFKYGVDDFDYVIYGGNLRFLYELNDVIFVRGVGGLSLAKIKSNTGKRPDVFSSYAGADLGAKFDFESGFYLSPFVGVGMTNADVLDVSDKNYLAHTGTDVGFKYFMDGVTYSYNLRAGVNTGGYLDASVGIGAWTVADKIGGGVSVGVVDTEFGWSGKFSANVKLAF